MRIWTVPRGGRDWTQANQTGLLKGHRLGVEGDCAAGADVDAAFVFRVVQISLLLCAPDLFHGEWEE